ncbi:MAG: type II secretion system inner membrane protein GspF [Pseudomonas sp.]|uniref:type II secretion system inner membrane protein GspF n=1 Tax=Pseudomonas sp. TaxID=306 RepID=UPI0030F05738
MAAYEYLAMNHAGSKSQGVLEADSLRQARQMLRDRKLIPLQVKRAQGNHGQGTGRSSAQRLNSTELALLTRQLATLVQAALPLEDVLAAVAAQSEKRRVQSIVLSVRARVQQGFSLAAALAEYPRAFPKLYQATVAAGEKSGHLDQVLMQLADYTEARQAASQQIQLALLYPGILLVASLSIVSFLLGYVVPDIVKVFVDSGHQLPLLTRALIRASAWVRDYGWAGLLLITGLVVGINSALRQPHIRQRWHQVQLHLPLFGKLVRASNCTRFVSTLAILGRSGVPLVDALHIAAEVVANQHIRGAMKRVAQSVHEGGSLTRALEQSGGFPPMMLYMIASGERSSTLDNMLDRAARQQEQYLSNRIAVLMGLFEPLTLVLMGAAVLVIVLAILLPILDLNQLVA